MINVGIHSNVVIEKAQINEKGTLEIHMKKVSEMDLMEMFNSGSDSAGAGEEKNTFLEYNQLAVNRFNNDLTVEQITKDVFNFKNKLAHILLLYKTEAACKWDIYRGTGIKTSADIKAKIANQNILDTLYKNICEDFIKNLVGVDLSKKFHLKTVRQSAAKHYSKLPDSQYGFTGQNAFVQDGSLECTLKYSKFEIEKKRNNPYPVESTDTISPEESASQSSAIDDVFGS